MMKTKANGSSLFCKNGQPDFKNVIDKLNSEYEHTDESALILAYKTAKLYSTCRCCGVGKGVGAIFIKNGKIICFGYNGVSKYIQPCTKDTCIRVALKIPNHTNRDICYGDCAEKRAIANAVSNSIDLEGSTVYITKSPCVSCTKMLIDVGVKKVIYHKVYSDPDFSFRLMDMANVEYTELNSPRLTVIKRNDF